MMNWNLVSENWNHLAPHIRQQWDKLTHEDLAEIDGNQEALTAKLQARYGFNRMDAEKKVADWGAELTPRLEKEPRPSKPVKAAAAPDQQVEDDGPSADPRFKIADEERPESPTSKVTPPLDRHADSRDRPATRSSTDNVIP